MKRFHSFSLVATVAILGAAVSAAGCGGTSTVTKTVTEAASTKSEPGPPNERAQFGYIKSLVRKGSGFEMRFDPAWFLSGVTANTAAAEDGVVPAGQPVPNDNYRLDEGHRLLTYLVPANARVTVLTNHGNPSQLGATPITVAELMPIVSGKSHLALTEPISTGFWISVDIDTVRSLDQQYQP